MVLDAHGPTTTLALMEAAAQSGVTVQSLSVQSTTLDDVFVHYAGRALRDALQEQSADTGYFNTGVRPSFEDKGLDGVDDFGVPFSLLSLSLLDGIGLVPVTLAHGRTESVPLRLGWGTNHDSRSR